MKHEPGATDVCQGSLLRLAQGREIAIYERNGAVLVADFSGGSGEIVHASEWFRNNGRKVAHAQRRGKVEIVSPVPREAARRIECLHRPLDGPRDTPAARLAAEPGNAFAKLPDVSPTG